MRIQAALVGATLLLCTSVAQAVPFTLIPCPGGANACPGATVEQQVFLNTGLNGAILGNVGSQTGTPVFNITGDANLSAQGFAQISPGNSTLTTLTFTVPGYGFSDLIFDVRGTGSVLAVSGGNTDTELLTNGQNTFIALTTPGSLFTSLILYAEGGLFESVGQIRVSGLTALSGVPLPGALLLMGTGLVLVAGFGAARKEFSTRRPNPRTAELLRG